MKDQAPLRDILFLCAFLWILFYAKKRLRSRWKWEKTGKPSGMPITRRSLFRRAMLAWIAGLTVCAVGVEALVIGSFVQGTLPPIQMLQSQIFILSMIGLFLWRGIALMWCVPGKLFRRHGVDFEAMLKDRRMISDDGRSFCYQDADWFVEAEECDACVVFAPLIDFSVPFHYHEKSAYVYRQCH